MRDYILERNNCEDIALNFIAGYYYPELPPHGVSNKGVEYVNPKIAISTKKGHFEIRSKCVEDFTKMLGINTAPYVSNPDTFPNK